jgi:hypothetical protein
MAVSPIAKVGLASGAVGLVIGLSAHGFGGGEGGFRDTVEHRLESSAVSGKQFKTDGLGLAEQSPATPASLKVGEAALALNLGAKNPDKPGNKIGALTVCTIATINAPNEVGANHVLEPYAAALSSEHSEDDATRENADGLYRKAAQDCASVALGIALRGDQLDIPLSQQP